MSGVELVVALAAAGAAVVGQRVPRAWLVLASVVGSLLVLAFGAPRWQLVPAGLALALLTGVTVLQLAGAGAPAVAPRTTAALALTGILASVLLSWALPVPRLSLEPGSGPVGTTAFDLVDPDRTSPSGRTAPGTPRRTTVQAWYPTDVTRGARARVTEDPTAFADAVGQFLGLPSFLLEHVGQARTSAFVDAPPSAGDRLPVVVSLHGWGGFRFAQAPLLEQLAADGHLVLAIDHTHGAVVAQPVDGEPVPLDPDLLPDGVPQPVYDAAATLLERTFADDALGLLAALRSADGQVPDEVLALADLDRVVLLGHSTGGGAALLACVDDGGCDALMTFDPWVVPVPDEVRAGGFPVPTTVLLSEEWTDDANHAVLRDLAAASGPDVTMLTLAGTRHRDVTLESRLSPLSARLGIAGPLGPDRTHEVALTVTRSVLARAWGTCCGDADLRPAEAFPEVVGAE